MAELSKKQLYEKTEKRRLHRAKRIRFGNLRLRLSFVTVRNEICAKCGKRSKETDMHHWVYVRIFPWFGREEVCPSCHMKLSRADTLKRRGGWGRSLRRTGH